LDKKPKTPFEAEQLIATLRGEIREGMVAEAQKVAAVNGIRWSVDEFPVVVSTTEDWGSI